MQFLKALGSASHTSARVEQIDALNTIENRLISEAKPRLISASVIAALLLFSSAIQVNAAVVTLNYTGTVSYGSDMTGLFGSPGADLSGDPASINFVFDTSVGTYSTAPTSMQVSGGTGDGTASPSLGSSVTINGITQFVAGAYNGTIAVENFGATNTLRASTNDFFADGITYTNNTIQASVSGENLPYSLNSSFSQTQQDFNPFDGYVRFQTNIAGLPVINTSASFYISSATETVLTSSVPEPSTWAMMLLGLGSLGFVTYRRARNDNGGSVVLPA